MKFCENCGKELFDEAVMCPGCGKMVDGMIPSAPAQTNTVENTAKKAPKPPKKKMSKKIKALIIVLCIVVGLIGAAVATYFVFAEYYWCNVNDCYNYRLEDGSFCVEHTCKHGDCLICRTSGSEYCYEHTCDESDCYALVVDTDYCKDHKCLMEGCDNAKGDNSYGYCDDHLCQYPLCSFPVANKDSDACSRHKCKESGCNEMIVAAGASRCDEHYGMRDLLTDLRMHFYLNSADGIVFTFSATNESTKTIKYVRFKAYLKNAVGDLISSDFSNDTYVSVEITGPALPHDTISIYSEIIGYCDGLARIDIDDITIVYTDGTTVSGAYGYYVS